MSRQFNYIDAQGNPILSELKKIFDSVVKDCPRSSTKNNLHSDPIKEDQLARKLRTVSEQYGMNVAQCFQARYAAHDPKLSYLFAQISNAILERTFHDGSCHLQAAYAWLELAKKRVFNASLVCSRTGNVLTEHYYLMILDNFSLGRLQSHKGQVHQDTYFRINPKSVHEKSVFFDPWSNRLCYWSAFKPDNRYTQPIIKTDQALFKCLSHLFEGGEKNIFESIIWCLNEYECRLRALPLDLLTDEPAFKDCQEPDDFTREIMLLSDSKKCVEALCSTIASYKLEFSALLEAATLVTATTSFFGDALEKSWKAYPAEKLVGTKYAGHRVCFFTMKGEKATRAGEFVQYLVSKGYGAEMKTTKTDPSIVVDMTVSRP